MWRVGVSQRYASDLARLRARAAAQPRVRLVAPGSLPAAELAVHLRMIWEFNTCELECGGFLLLEPWRIRWGSPDPDGSLPGHADALEFLVRLKGGRWDVTLYYC